MQVKDVMSKAVVDVRPEASIHDAIQLMLIRKVSGLPVVDRNGDLVGVLSEGDLLRRVELDTTPADHWYAHVFTSGGTAYAYTAAHSRRVGDVMSKAPITTTPIAPLAEAVTVMERHRIKRLPVVDQSRVVGIVSRSDFLRALAPRLAPVYEEAVTCDAEIERAILAELREQNWAANTGITVTVKDGDVVLNGWIITEAQRTATRVLAENVNGVRSVCDALAFADPMALISA